MIEKAINSKISKFYQIKDMNQELQQDVDTDDLMQISEDE